MKYIFHIDMNAFFASVEEAFDESLKNLPIVVAGKTKRSVVSSANYKARSYGIKAAMPIFIAAKMCRNLVIVTHHMERYLEYSDRFYQILTTNFTSKVERLSIDECYLDATDLVSTKEEAIQLAAKIQKCLLNQLGIGTSIGVSYNKFLAKMGSDMKKPLGITPIFQNEVKEIISKLPLNEMFMVGKASIEKLKLKKIFTIGDLAISEDHETLKKILNKNWLVHQQHANGFGSDILNFEHNIPKSIGISETFLTDTNNYEEISNKLKQLCAQLEKRLKHHKMSGLCITVTFKDKNFITINKSKGLSNYISNYEEIFSTAIKIFEDFHINNYLRLIGVRITKLIANDELPLKTSLFLEKETEKNLSETEILENIAGKINKKLKSQIIGLASEKNK